MTTQPPNWRIKLLLLAFGTLVALLAAEGGLRVAEMFSNPLLSEGWTAKQAQSKEYWAIYDPDLGYRQNPRFADMNESGLRDRPITPKGDRFRILMLGDSVAVYGDSIDDTFVGHLRTALRDKPGAEHLDVVNGGVKGYTNYQELLFLKKVGASLNPDLVGFEFCLNDLFKFLHSFELNNGRLVPGTYQFSTEAVGQSPEGFWRRVAKQSELLVWLVNKIPVARNAAALRTQNGFSFDYRPDVRTAWEDKPWLDIEDQLGEAVELGRGRGFQIFVVALPMAVQYDAQYLGRNRDYVLKPQRKLKEICERLGIAFYDAYPDLEPVDFIEDGLHLTAMGRQVLGQQIAAFLLRSGLIGAHQGN